MSPRVKAAMALVAVFALGGATGAAGMRFAVGRAIRRVHELPPAEVRKHLVLLALDRQLSLTALERERIGAIFDAHAPEMNAVARREEPELAPIITRLEAEIRQALAEDQRGRYDAMVAHYNERRRKALADGP